MKTYSRIPWVVISLFLMLCSCSEDDDIIDPKPPIEAVGDFYKLKIKGSSNLDFTSLIALSIYDSQPIGANNEFKLEAKTGEEDEELPALIIQNEEVLFGYYPNYAVGGEITKRRSCNFSLNNS